jgi:hypothetical protein
MKALLGAVLLACVHLNGAVWAGEYPFAEDGTKTQDKESSLGPVSENPTAGGPLPVIGPNDRIGWSSDGNTVDPDDWSATALALAIFAKAGWQDRLVHWDFNNRLDVSHAWKEKENVESTLGGARKFMFDRSKFFDDQNRLQAAIDHAAAEINRSSADSKFWYVQAGPFEVAYRAILKADPAKRKYCILVSHSAVNEVSGKWVVVEKDHTKRPSAGKDECVALGAEYFYTGGQGGTDRFGAKKLRDWSVVAWMGDSPCPEYRWVHSRFLKTAEHKSRCLDASDGGMAFYLATGDPDGNFDPKLKKFLGTNWLRPKATP